MSSKVIRLTGVFIVLPLLLGIEVAAAQVPAQPQVGTEEEALRRRVAQLENRVLQLETQIAELTALLGADRPDIQALATHPPRSALQILNDAHGWQRVESWRRLRRGLSQIEVRYLLGEPAFIAVDSLATVWVYPSGARVNFGTEGRRLEAWSEW